MLVKCEHCKFNKRCEYHWQEESGLVYCTDWSLSPEHEYRYRLAHNLYEAVLDRLLDPKNVCKGEFSDVIDDLFFAADEEMQKLKIALAHISIIPIRKNLKRTIEECGDVAAYLAAIIDVVGGGE